MRVPSIHSSLVQHLLEELEPREERDTKRSPESGPASPPALFLCYRLPPTSPEGLLAVLRPGSFQAPPEPQSEEEAWVAGPWSRWEYGIGRWENTQKGKRRKEGSCHFQRAPGCAELSTRYQAPGLYHLLEFDPSSHFQDREIQADGGEATCLRSATSRKGGS